jgi:hypothetical protein
MLEDLEISQPSASLPTSVLQCFHNPSGEALGAGKHCGRCEKHVGGSKQVFPNFSTRAHWMLSGCHTHWTNLGQIRSSLWFWTKLEVWHTNTKVPNATSGHMLSIGCYCHSGQNHPQDKSGDNASSGRGGVGLS